MPASPTAGTAVPRRGTLARRLLMKTDPRMKKCDPNHANRRATHARHGSGTTATLNAILKIAYRRHTRGRVALAAVTACLGR